MGVLDFEKIRIKLKVKNGKFQSKLHQMLPPSEAKDLQNSLRNVEKRDKYAS